MSKNSVKAEAAKPYSEQTSLGGPIPIVMGTGPMACRLKISGKILERSGLKPNDKIELIAVGDGQILIKKIGEPVPGLPFKSTTGTTRMLDALMEATREREAEMKAAREQRYAFQEETEAEAEEPEEPLDEEQRRREEL